MLFKEKLQSDSVSDHYFALSALQSPLDLPGALPQAVTFRAFGARKLSGATDDVPSLRSIPVQR
jgi:hypothetical protein